MKYGSNRACGCNHNLISIHAEQYAINYCRANDKRNRYEIYIWRYTKDGNIKTIYCCNRCIKLANKYSYENKIYTFKNNTVISAISNDHRYDTLGYRIRKK